MRKFIGTFLIHNLLQIKGAASLPLTNPLADWLSEAIHSRAKFSQNSDRGNEQNGFSEQASGLYNSRSWCHYDYSLCYLRVSLSSVKNISVSLWLLVVGKSCIHSQESRGVQKLCTLAFAFLFLRKGGQRSSKCLQSPVSLIINEPYM